MDADQLYHFLFETYPGVGILFGATIIICLIACVIMERHTRKIYKNHEKTEDDWSFFDDDDDEDEEDSEDDEESRDDATDKKDKKHKRLKKK